LPKSSLPALQPWRKVLLLLAVLLFLKVERVL
jgi:hypothetical protein